MQIINGKIVNKHFNFSYKPGRVVVVLNGRHAGKKAVIVKTNYENSKEKKFPHCLVVGLSKPPRRVTKKSLKNVEEHLRKLESSKNQESAAEQIIRMKRLGIFVKTYNMTHLLVTRYNLINYLRYKCEEDLGLHKGMDRLEKSENDVREKQVALLKKENERSEANKQEVDNLRKDLGALKDKYRQTLRDVKGAIGGQMFDRFMRGFVRTRDNVEENEKISHSEFLFKKLKF